MVLKNMDELEEFCKELRALVVSSPVPMDLRSLERDYRSFLGKSMPLQRFGYKNLITFLKERCSNFFVLEGAIGNPIVTLIVPKALEHINRLVSKQRLSGKDKTKGKRWSIIRPPDRNEQDDSKKIVSSKPIESLTTNGRKGNSSSESDTHDHISLAEDSGRASVDSVGYSSTSSGRSPAIDILAKQLTELIADYPEGLWTTDLLKAYREQYGRELCYERYGVSSGIALMRMLEGTVFYVRRPEPLGDWRLYDARRPPPPDDDYDACAVSTPAPVPPAVDAAPGDVMVFLNTIRSESVAALEPSVMFDVLVGEIYSPSHFWVLRRDDQHCGLLYAIMDAMNEYYDDGEGAKRSLTDEMEVRIGLYCAARYDRDWHRALVIQLPDSDTALLRYIDYGTVGREPIKSLKPLLKCWSELPAQGIRARLAGVMPPSRARHWPHTSSAEFLQIVRDLALVAEVVAVDYEEGIVELFLVDTSEAEDVCVNDLLIQKGFAAQRFDSVLGKNESYLRPTFGALEGGLTLSYADICSYIEHDINLSCIDSYRRYVLDEPPRPSPTPPRLAPASTMPASTTPATPPRRSLAREESRFISTLDCQVFVALLTMDYALAVEQARSQLNCPCFPDDAAVWLTAAEYQHLERLRDSNVASAAVYLDRLIRARLPPAADYPVAPPSYVLARAAFFSP